MNKEGRKKIAVLHVIDSLPREGAEMVVYDLIHRGSRDRYSFMVCALTRGGGVEEMLRAIGVPVFVLGRKSRWDIRSFFRLVGLIKAQRVEIVHTHLFSSHLWGAAGAFLAGRKALIRTEHNMSEWKSAARRLLDCFLSRLTDRIVAVSEPVRQSLIAVSRVPAQKVVLIRNGLNPGRIRTGVNGGRDAKLRELGVPPGSKLVGSVAALTPKKGLRYLLGAAESILRRRRDVHFLLLGDGELREELESSIRAKGLTGRVQMLGSRADALEIVSLLDVFVLSSLREGLPIALLEAMALARPVVVTSVGEMANMVQHRVSGLLVPPGDEAGLAGAIELIINNPLLGKKLGEKAAATVLSGYDIEETVRAYEDCYRSVLGRE